MLNFLGSILSFLDSHISILFIVIAVLLYIIIRQHNSILSIVSGAGHIQLCNHIVYEVISRNVDASVNKTAENATISLNELYENIPDDFRLKGDKVAFLSAIKDLVAEGIVQPSIDPDSKYKDLHGFGINHVAFTYYNRNSDIGKMQKQIRAIEVPIKNMSMYLARIAYVLEYIYGDKIETEEMKNLLTIEDDIEEDVEDGVEEYKE